jgi:Zn-dependent oligopeptidase
VKKNYKLDSEKIREYFPVEQVKEQTMEIYQDLLVLKFSKLEGAPTWHEDVKVYQVQDKAS